MYVSVIQLPLVGVPLRAGLHAAVVVAPAPTSVPKRSKALVIDFLPVQATSPLSAFQLLSGVGTPGLQRCRRRHVAQERRTRAEHAGPVRDALLTNGSADDEAVLLHLEEVVREWQQTNGWKDLRLGSRDCHAYARAVVAFLCDEV
jgi:hypothetical protein